MGRDKRIKSLIQLKEDMQSVQDRLKGQNEKNRKKAEELEARRVAEKSEILAAGGNPYAVWRQQDAERCNIYICVCVCVVCMIVL